MVETDYEINDPFLSGTRVLQEGKMSYWWRKTEEIIEMPRMGWKDRSL
jgi:hypothetical protein